MSRSRWYIGAAIIAIFVTAIIMGGCAKQSPKPGDAKPGDAWKPAKPIALIVPSKPGGGHDTTARIFAKHAEKYAGVPITIVNEDQGAGVVAFTKLMQAKPDGYTVGQLSSAVVSDQYLVRGVKYTHETFVPICQIAEDPNCLVVKTGGPYDKPLEQFIAEAKNNPKKVRIGVSGNWTNHDYVREQVEMATGVKFQRVSIKGGAQIVMSILAGDLDAGVPYPSEIQGQVSAGQLKVLAHSGSQRLAVWPDVPTFKEKGIAADLTVWRVLGAPPGTPDNVVKGLYAIFEKTAKDPELIKAFKDAGIGLVFKDQNAAAELIKEAHIKNKQIIDKAGLAKK